MRCVTSNANAMHESFASVLRVDFMAIFILLPLMKRVHSFAYSHFLPYRRGFLKADLEKAKLNLQGIWANMTTQFSDFGQNEVLQVSFYFLLIITIFIAKKKYCGLTL